MHHPYGPSSLPGAWALGPSSLPDGMRLGHVLSSAVQLLNVCMRSCPCPGHVRDRRDRGETRRGLGLVVRCSARATHTPLHPQGPHSECLATPWGKEHTSTITVCVRVPRTLCALLLYENMVYQGLCQSYLPLGFQGTAPHAGWLASRSPPAMYVTGKRRAGIAGATCYV